MKFNKKNPREFHKYQLNKFRNIYTDPDLRDTGGGLANYFMNLSHNFLETSLPKQYEDPTILELGASDTRHMDIVKNYSSYTLSDKNIEILSSSLKNLPTNIKYLELDAANVNANSLNDRFDRIIACNLLEHLPKPEEMLFNWYELLNDGGIISLLQPCDPGMLWRLGRKFGPRKGLENKGINYDLLMAMEHINYISNIITISHECFESNISYFPFKIPSWNFNLFAAIHIQK